MASSQPNKIAPGPLRDFVDGDNAQHASVIVEAATEPLVDELPRTGLSGVTTGKLRFSKPKPKSRLVDDLGDRLRKLTGGEPTFLKLAEAYVVTDVTPEQLREIASWSQTGVIRPNRLHTTKA